MKEWIRDAMEFTYEVTIPLILLALIYAIPVSVVAAVVWYCIRRLRR